MQHVALHHVAHGAGRVVVLAAALDAHLLGDGDLHVAHRAAVPQRLEDRVAEAQRQQVLHRLLAKVMIDAKELPFGKDRADRGVDGLRTRTVVAERLFQHHARQRRDEPVTGEALADGSEQPRGGGQIKHSYAGVALREPVRERGEAGRVGAVHGQVVDSRAELGPGCIVQIIGGDELPAVVAEQRQIVVATERAAREAKDAPARRLTVVAKGVVQGRQQFALGQIARGAEEDQVELVQCAHHAAPFQGRKKRRR